MASAATFSSRSTRRAPKRSRAPSAPKALAAAAPKPLEAPVIRTHLLSRGDGMIVFHLKRQAGCNRLRLFRSEFDHDACMILRSHEKSRRSRLLWVQISRVPTAYA